MTIDEENTQARIAAEAAYFGALEEGLSHDAASERSLQAAVSDSEASAANASFPAVTSA